MLCVPTLGESAQKVPCTNYSILLVHNNCNITLLDSTI